MDSELEQFYDDLTSFNEKQNILWNLRNKKFYKQKKLNKITSYINFLAYHANEYFDFDENDPRYKQQIIVCENSEKVFDYL
jgi:hypothetical protein